MSTSRSRRRSRAEPTRRRSRKDRARQVSRRAVDLSEHSLPGTQLHRLSLLVSEASRGLEHRKSAQDAHLHLRNPLRVAEEVKGRIASQGPLVQKRVAAEIAPDLALPRALPLGIVSLLVGVALVATQRYWALPFMAYGAVALTFDSVVRRRFQRRLFAAVDEAIRPDLQLITSDRTRAEAIAERFDETGDLGFMESLDRPEGVLLPQGERVLLRADGVLKAREVNGGFLREAEGRLLLTTARLLFHAGEHAVEMELSRVVRADVVDELRLVVLPSKREPPAIYFTLGNAHTFSRVISLTRRGLGGGRTEALK